MARISGVDLPNEKRLDIALTYIYGVGRSNAEIIIRETNMDGSRRVKSLTDEEVNKIAKAIEKHFTVEGDLRRQISDNVKRLREIGTYRGMRHARGLPSRGQRTRSNARTKRGKRATVGALKKEDRVRIDQKPAEEAKK